MDKKVKNNDDFVVDEMIKNYWNVLCDGQKWKGKIPLDVNSTDLASIPILTSSVLLYNKSSDIILY
jgi:hypothetical protein